MQKSDAEQLWRAPDQVSGSPNVDVLSTTPELRHGRRLGCGKLEASASSDTDSKVERQRTDDGVPAITSRIASNGTRK